LYFSKRWTIKYCHTDGVSRRLACFTTVSVRKHKSLFSIKCFKIFEFFFRKSDEPDVFWKDFLCREVGSHPKAVFVQIFSRQIWIKVVTIRVCVLQETGTFSDQKSSKFWEKISDLIKAIGMNSPFKYTFYDSWAS